MKITFELFEISSQFKFGRAEEEIKLSYKTRFDCDIIIETYSRQRNLFTIDLEIDGDNEKIMEATRESEYVFKKYCNKVTVKY